MTELSLGEKIQQHINLATVLQPEIIKAAVERSLIDGTCGVLVSGIFESSGIRIRAELDHRVPFGEIYIVDYTNFELKAKVDIPDV